MQETQFNPWVRKIPCRREWPPTPVFLPGESHGQRSLAGCKESDMTEQLQKREKMNRAILNDSELDLMKRIQATVYSLDSKSFVVSSN